MSNNQNRKLVKITVDARSSLCNNFASPKSPGDINYLRYKSCSVIEINPLVEEFHGSTFSPSRMPLSFVRKMFEHCYQIIELFQDDIMAGLFLIIIIIKKSEYLLSDPCEEHDWSEGSPQQATTGSATCRASKGEKESNVKDISK